TIKPDFRKLGPRFGKEMKAVVQAVEQLNSKDIAKIEAEGTLSIEVNQRMVMLDRDEVEIVSEDLEGWSVASSDDITVALDVELNDDLRNEGIARELINRIQNLRKDQQLEVTDHIDLKIKKDGTIERAI